MYNFYFTPSKDTYTESIRFSTLTFESVNGVQKSKPLLSTPKLICKYSALVFLTYEHMRIVNGFLDGLVSEVVHPLWGRGSEITSTTSGNTIYCNTDEYTFTVGETIFVVKSYDTYDVVTITAVNAGNLVVSSSVTAIAGKLVLPTFRGIVKGFVDTSYTGENYAVCNIVMEELV